MPGGSGGVIEGLCLLRPQSKQMDGVIMIESVMQVISDNRFWIMPLLAVAAVVALVNLLIDLLNGFHQDFYD